jgi:uncharacterized protein (TIGR03083 family)
VLSTESARTIDHLAALEMLTAQFARTLATTPLDARPVTFREWTLADLAAHLGEVHRWAAATVETGHRADRSNRPELTMDPVAWYEQCRARLLDVLAATDPERSCWTHHPDDRIVRYWHRRQAHETLVHLWDARSAADPDAPLLRDITPAICADGVDELLTVFPRRASPAARTPLPGRLALRALDADRSWTVLPDWTLLDGAQEPVDAEVAAPAGALLLYAWRRPLAAAAVTTDGDAAVIATFDRAQVVP